MYTFFGGLGPTKEIFSGLRFIGGYAYRHQETIPFEENRFIR